MTGLVSGALANLFGCGTTFDYRPPIVTSAFVGQYINLSAIYYNRAQQAVNRPPAACHWCGRTFDKSELDRASCRTCGGYK